MLVQSSKYQEKGKRTWCVVRKNGSSVSNRTTPSSPPKVGPNEGSLSDGVMDTGLTGGVVGKEAATTA